jgi:AcrR family transcriptional regulator
MGRPARRQREIEHVREDILHAAGRAFSRQGFESVTIHDIAKEAGYTATSLYAYFKGKQEIIDALLAGIIEEFKGAFNAEIPTGLSFHQRLAFLFGRFSEVADRWPEARLLMRDLKRSDSTRCGHKDGRDLDARLVEWLKQNVTSAKDLAGREPESIGYIVRSLIIGAFLPGDLAMLHTSSSRERFTLALQVCLYGIGGKVPAKEPRPS